MALPVSAAASASCLVTGHSLLIGPWGDPLSWVVVGGWSSPCVFCLDDSSQEVHGTPSSPQKKKVVAQVGIFFPVLQCSAAS